VPGVVTITVWSYTTEAVDFLLCFVFKLLSFLQQAKNQQVLEPLEMIMLVVRKMYWFWPSCFYYMFSVLDTLLAIPLSLGNISTEMMGFPVVIL